MSSAIPVKGDASQHILRDQLLAVANRPDVRFVVISSDVVYPVGAMKDYEAKFWLPFKGVTKPVYAIPGNHDWYDALEAFAATFLEPGAAHAAMRARVETDLRLTSTTDARIDQLIQHAAWLRQQYRVPTGFQRAPFFEIQTDRFALIAVDTGVVKRVDPEQMLWLRRGARPRARQARHGDSGTSILCRWKRTNRRGTMILPSSSACCSSTTSPSSWPGYARLRVLRRAAREKARRSTISSTVAAVRTSASARRSRGRRRPATTDWAFYPDRAAVTAKIQAETPWWKRPAWWWTRQFGAWPFTAEWLSAAFDYNVAPFFQSFVEVRVERSSDRIVLRPYGVNGRLTWGELGSSESVRPAGAQRDTPVEWSVPMGRR